MRDAARRGGKPAGLGVYRPFREAQTLKNAVDEGFNLILIGSDEAFMLDACHQIAHNRAEVGI